MLIKSLLTWLQAKSDSRRRLRVNLRQNLEGLESRALLSARGQESLVVAADVQVSDQDASADIALPPVNLQAVTPSATVEVSANARNRKADPESSAVPRISGVAGTYQFSSSGLGNGSVAITQQGLSIAGVFTAPNLTSGTFTAQFRTDRAKVAKGSATFVFTDSPTPENFGFIVRFYPDGTLKSFRYR